MHGAFELARRGGIYTCTALAAIACLNAVSYSAATAGALVQADAWYFLDTFVRQYVTGSLDLGSFFGHRDSSDHVQPLLRLIMWLHLHLFALDFRIEGVIGALFGVLTALFVAHVYLAEAGRPRLSSAFVAAAIVAAVVSLNSTNIYTWSLVSLSFVSLLLFVILLMAAWHVLANGRGYVLLAFAAVLTLASGDKFATIAFACAVIAAFLLARDLQGLFRGAIVLTVLVAAALLFGTLSTWLHPAPAAQETAWLASLVKHSPAQVAKALLDVLTSSLIHREHIGRIVPNWVGWGIGIVLAILHGLFWASYLIRGTASRAAYVAAALMLLSYATVAGVVVGRSGVFGLDYLQQPRYVIFYQLMNVALLLRLSTVGSVRGEAALRHSLPLARGSALAIAALVATLQPPLAWKAWDLNKYVSEYQQEAAMQLGALAADPTRVPSGCKDILVICRHDVEKRRDLIGLLRTHQLNVFSRRFQLVHRLYPDLDSVPRAR